MSSLTRAEAQALLEIKDFLRANQCRSFTRAMVPSIRKSTLLALESKGYLQTVHNPELPGIQTWALSNPPDGLG